MERADLLYSGLILAALMLSLWTADFSRPPVSSSLPRSLPLARKGLLSASHKLQSLALLFARTRGSQLAAHG